jgi:hypothetical protein
MSAVATKVQIWSVPFAGGEPKLLGDGDEPVISPKSDRVAFVKDRGIWSAPVDASTPAKRLFFARGDCGSPRLVARRFAYRLCFQSRRSLVHRHLRQRLDSDRLSRAVDCRAIRARAGRLTENASRLCDDRETAARPSRSSNNVRKRGPSGRQTRRRRGKSTVEEPVYVARLAAIDAGGTNLHWAAAGRIVFMSYLDGWPHLYSISEKAASRCC